MSFNREGYWVTDYERECTRCGALFEKKSRTVTLCPTCNSDRVKCSDPRWKMHQRAKCRAKSKGLEFSIEVSDITIPNECPILGITLKINKGRPGAYEDSPSLDRVDNSRGYTKDNIQVVSQRANAMKGAATNEQLVKFAKYILEELSENS